MKRPKLQVLLPLPRPFHGALGHLIAQWAYFEDQFDATHHLLRMHPEAVALAPNLPHSFDKRMDLFRRSVKLCFPADSSICAHLRKIASEAATLKHFRDLLAHGRWSVEADGTVRIYNFRRGTVQYEAISLEKLRSATTKVSDLSSTLFAVQNPGWTKGPHLTSDERSVLQRFLHDYQPKLPTPKAPSLPRQSSRE